MKILEMNIEKYLDELKTHKATPGGGSVAGLTASQAIALNLMVINITLQNKKYEEYFKLNEELKLESEQLYRELVLMADKDVVAFEKLSKAYKLPKDSEEEKEYKKEVLAEASLEATRVPFELIELSKRGIEITKKLLNNSSKMAVSDLGVAALLFRGASKSAWLNVKINLPYLADKESASSFEKRGEDLLKYIEEIGTEVYEKVEASL